MIDLLIFYVLGILIVSSFLTIWFETTIVVHISKLLRISKDDIFTFDEWSDDLLARAPFFGELFSCPLCLGFWVSVVTASCIQTINDLTLWFIPACSLSWSVIVFLFFKVVTKRD
jgi:hypothetical protein